MADLLRIIVAILLPPLGVFLQVGFAGAFWLNILLTLLGYIPGIIHAVWISARREARRAPSPKKACCRATSGGILRRASADQAADQPGRKACAWMTAQ